MLIICDFDGTVTARDTNAALARQFAPVASAQVEGRLRTRELTLRQVLSTEFEQMTAGLDAIVAAALEIPFRDGFTELIELAESRGDQVVLLSSGFREVIEPMLDANGLLGRIPLVSNEIELDERGGRITWRELPECDLCGEPCKRHDVARLREQYAGSDDLVVFVGDGFSDRCGAETADRVFARDSLASYLDREGVAYDRWDDFHDVIAALDLRAGVDA